MAKKLIKKIRIVIFIFFALNFTEQKYYITEKKTLAVF